jgi:hypothetical protein
VRGEKIATASAQDGQGAGGAGEHEGMARSGNNGRGVCCRLLYSAGLQIRRTRDGWNGQLGRIRVLSLVRDIVGCYECIR